MDEAVAGDFDFEPLGEGVDAFGADAVEAAGVLVGALAELAAGMEVGEDEFDGGDAPLGVDIDRDAAAVVADGDRAVDVDRHLDALAEPGEVFVDGVVEHLEDAVVEAAFVGVADVHARPFADRLETFQLVDLRGVVGLGVGRRGGLGRGRF
jgi:hypothetical protein